MTPKKVITYLLSSAFIFSAIYLPINSLKRIDDVEPIKEQSNNNIVKEDIYTVRSHNGKISVFSQNQEEPIYTLDSPYVRDLPEHDRALLNEGIIASNKEELLKILEDYDY